MTKDLKETKNRFLKEIKRIKKTLPTGMTKNEAIM